MYLDIPRYPNIMTATAQVITYLDQHLAVAAQDLNIH
jgi:hypothetical protein